jgi:hypothetical protein
MSETKKARRWRRALDVLKIVGQTLVGIFRRK